VDWNERPNRSSTASRVQPGWQVVDVGCGPLGILDLLADRVGPAGEAVGLERESRLVEMGQTILAQRGLRNARLVLGDVYSGLLRASFDLVHTRLLLINLKDPEGALAELTAMVRPGGVVAVQDIDQVPWLCEPPHPAWETLVSAFLMVWRANGLDPLIGRRLPALLRAAGLVDVEVEVHARADTPGTYHRKQRRSAARCRPGEIFVNKKPVSRLAVTPPTPFSSCTGLSPS